MRESLHRLLEGLKGRAGLWVLSALATAGLVLLAIQGAQLFEIDAALSQVRVRPHPSIADAVVICDPQPPGAYPDDCTRLTPHGIVDWELALAVDWTPPLAGDGAPVVASETRANAERILNGWNDAAGEGFRPLDLAKRSLELDGLFILAYAVLLVALVLLAARQAESGLGGAWLAVAALPVLAGAADLVENVYLRRQLPPDGSVEIAVDASHAVIAGIAASLKFLLLTATGCALVLAAVVGACFWLGRPRLSIRDRLSKVLAREREYIERRRELAGLADKCRDDPRPFGVALSGGGLRSATLNLGVLQALARLGLLPNFDYLSTVSGGGYIGSALSSLLSINARRMKASREGRDEQYGFGEGESALFSTSAESFPLAASGGRGSVEGEAGLDAATQLAHLRSSGEFLVQQRGLLSLEFLRTVGGVTYGFLYHLLLFGLLFVTIASGYLWVVYMMVGRNAVRGAGVSAGPEDLTDKYLDFAWRAFGGGVGGEWWEHPFVAALAIGALVTALTVAIGRALISRFRAGLYERRGRLAREIRNQVAVGGLVVITFMTAFGVTWWYVRIDPHRLLNISLPLMVYLGGGLVLLVRHVRVAASRSLEQDDRSRLGARQGAFIYLTIASLVLVLFILPFLVFFDFIVDRLGETPIRGFAAWILSLLGARAIAAGGASKARANQSTGPLSRVSSLLPAARRLFVGAVFSLAVIGSLLLICAVIWTREDWIIRKFADIDTPFGARLAIALTALALFCLAGLPNFNRLALHYSYRDRLAEAYLRTARQDPREPHTLAVARDNEAMKITDLHGQGDTEAATSAPYHLLVSCLNLSAERDLRRRSRKTDQFVFAKLHCGSEITGFVPTAEYRGGDSRLAEAMTISGAAASPAMGRRTFFAQSAAMTLLNVRLGQWLENPGYRGGQRTGRREKGVFWPWYLLKEALGSTDANGRLVFLSDGGHSGDNLGICPLLKRRCRLILAIDAEFDPEISCGSLNEALRQIRIDEGVAVQIDLAALRKVGRDGRSRRHFAVGRIDYPATAERSAESGWLVVLKSTLTGDESEMIGEYRARNPDFPHQSTGDQFFDEAQFEAYRELGEHLVETSLVGNLRDLLGDGFCDPDWQARFAKLVPRRQPVR